MEGTVEDHAEQARILSIQSQECAKRLQTLKNDEVLSTNTDANPMINRTSIDTAASVRSITDSILSLYGHESLYGTPSTSADEVLGTRSMQNYQARVSRTIEDYIRKSPIIDLDRPDSPLISPRTSQNSSDPSTASNDMSVGKVEVEYLEHLLGMAYVIATDVYEHSSDQHQYKSERIVSGFLLRDARGVTLKEFYVQAASLLPKGKECRYYKISVTLPHRIRHSHLDPRPMIILDSLIKQLPLHDPYMLRVRYLQPEKRAMMILDHLVRHVLL